jgi:hypothetical protein
MSNGETLTEAPTTVERVDELVPKKDSEYPNDPACNVGGGAQDPVTTRTGHSGGFRIRELCHTAKQIWVNRNVKWGWTRCYSLDQDVHSIEIEKGLKGHVGENDERK